MQLYLLRANIAHDAFSPWYDKAFGFVVRAYSEKHARNIASENAGDERAEAWQDTDATSCDELPVDGESEMILRDFAAA